MSWFSRLYYISFSFLMVLTLCGCQTYLEFAHYVHPFSDPKYPHGKSPLLDQSHPPVCFSATLGFLTGYIAAGPISLANEILLGSTYRKFTGMTSDSYSKEAGLISEFPSIILGAAGEYAVGIPCWMLFGWWWPAQCMRMPDSLQEKQTEQPRLRMDKAGTTPPNP